MAEPRSYAFLFVCQSGELELKAALLAASLRRHVRCPAELIACVPEPAERWGTIRELTRRLLARLGVRIAPIRNQVADDYPIGNKVSCFGVPVTSRQRVFVDSDIVCTAPFDGDERLDVPLSATAAGEAALEDDAQWRRAYRAAGLPLPDLRIPTSIHGDLMLPYYNSGWVCADRDLPLEAAWLEACRKIDGTWRIPNKRPNLDQIALPVAARKLGVKVRLLDPSFNHPAHRMPLEGGAAPRFSHYHRVAVLRREPRLAELARDLCREEPLLAELLRSDPEWALLLREPRRSAPGDGIHDLLVTGIPRSGTSFLCNLVHRHDNCVVLNEPDGLVQSLRREATPYAVLSFLRERRRAVVEGEPIRNKLKDGQVTDDTVLQNEQVEYVPKVRSDDFVLGVKNTLLFLGRLRDLRRAVPRARVAICVRNPFDTIASWKETFEHLQSADVAGAKVVGLNDQMLSAVHRRHLSRIAGIPSVAVRRAAWWAHMAGLVLDADPGFHLVRYRALAEDPQAVLRPLLDGLPAGTTAEPIVASGARTSRRARLDDADLEAIETLCRGPAEALGVWEPPLGTGRS